MDKGFLVLRSIFASFFLNNKPSFHWKKKKFERIKGIKKYIKNKKNKKIKNPHKKRESQATTERGLKEDISFLLHLHS